MKNIDLPFGSNGVSFEFDKTQFEIIGKPLVSKSLTDLELGLRFDKPIDSARLEEAVKPGETVLIAVPDGTRNAGVGQIVNLLVRRLIANGTMPFEISILFATGLHRQVTDKERADILTPFIAQRVSSHDHNPNDLMSLLRIGETTGGIPIEINRRLVDADHVILIGSIGFHYYAGFSGGRKLVCPGLASKRTIKATHNLAFDPANKERAQGALPGRLAGNAVHESFVEAAGLVAPSFLFNTFVDDDGNITDLECGNWKSSHEAACKRYAEKHTVDITGKRELVIVSAGGAPFDINMVQAHKAIEMASYACADGGTIILIAECGDGAGGSDFEKACGLSGSVDIADKLAEQYTVGGQTAWSLRKKAERFDLKIISKLPREFVEQTGIQHCTDLADALSNSPNKSPGYILPYGAKFLPVI
jgi:nickel-dependent lactate racemase